MLLWLAHFVIQLRTSCIFCFIVLSIMIWDKNTYLDIIQMYIYPLFHSYYKVKIHSLQDLLLCTFIMHWSFVKKVWWTFNINLILLNYLHTNAWYSKIVFVVYFFLPHVHQPNVSRLHSCMHYFYVCNAFCFVAYFVQLLCFCLASMRIGRWSRN